MRVNGWMGVLRQRKGWASPHQPPGAIPSPFEEHRYLVQLFAVPDDPAAADVGVDLTAKPLKQGADEWSDELGIFGSQPS